MAVTRKVHRLTFEQVRKASLLTLGLAIGAYEAFVEHADRPQILIFAAGLLGLDTFLKRDAGHSDDKKEPPRDPPPSPAQSPTPPGNQG